MTNAFIRRTNTNLYISGKIHSFLLGLSLALDVKAIGSIDNGAILPEIFSAAIRYFLACKIHPV